MAISPQTRQLQEIAQLVRQHKDAIRNTLGSPPTGTGTSFSSQMKESFTRQDAEKVAKATNVSVEQAELICQAWPVYQLGYQDGQSGQSGSSR